jgi:phosphoribosylformimino-5-aminoimidazole carboxamide ribotide isomerase
MSVLVIPAIDLKRGRCVRLVQGRAENETVFSEDPVATALEWQAQGAPRLHVVDLDGAWAGAPAQAAIVRAIIGALSIPVEVGGGLRDRASVEQVLEAGARWAVIGTRAALDPTFLGEICRACEERIIVSVDASDGRVAVDGWTRVLDLDAVALVRDAAAAGAAAILYTDIARDGTQEGPNLWSTEAVAKVAGIAILASGGVSCLDDLRQLAGIPGVEGAIVGRALYSGAVDLRRALAEVGG